MGCFASKIHGVLSPREAEVYELHQAIIWVIRLNLSIVRFELDAKFVVDSFHSSCLDESEFGRPSKSAKFFASKESISLFVLLKDTVTRLLMF